MKYYHTYPMKMLMLYKELREKILQAGNILGAKTITEYETKRIPGCIQDIAPNKKWSNIL